MTNKMPEALRLADALESQRSPHPYVDKAAAMLRTQHALLEDARNAMLAAKAEFNDFFRYANAGDFKAAGRCVMNAELWLTRDSLAALNQHLDKP